MRLTQTSRIAVAGAALLSLFPTSIVAIGPHASLARRHMHHHHEIKHKLRKRGECQFPTDKGLVPVTPDAMNAGWAMSPDQPCKPGMYCPYACPAGQLMAQWDPTATSYSYPQSMNGGLHCNESGEIEIPFPDKPLCYDGTGSFSAKNLAGAPVAICQTVLPGNEAMLIPTVVVDEHVLAVPDTSYWCGTAAHYYINPPGVSAEEGCVWGSKAKPYGNWSPYVTGANELPTGETFVKIGWNPIYLEPDVPFRDVLPDWGVRIECEDGDCGGLPCEIDPAIHGVNEVANMHGSGAGGANFCVVAVPKGATATLVIFKKGGESNSDNPNKPPKYKAPKTTSTTTTSPTTTTDATTSQIKTTTETETTSTTSTTSSTVSISKTSTTETSTTSEESTSIPYRVPLETTRPKLFADAGPDMPKGPDGPDVGGVFVANKTINGYSAPSFPTATSQSSSPSEIQKGAASATIVSQSLLLLSGFVGLVTMVL